MKISEASTLYRAVATFVDEIGEVPFPGRNWIPKLIHLRLGYWRQEVGDGSNKCVALIDGEGWLTTWLVVEPTPLKNMLIKLGSLSPAPLIHVPVAGRREAGRKHIQLEPDSIPSSTNFKRAHHRAGTLEISFIFPKIVGVKITKYLSCHHLAKYRAIVRPPLVNSHSWRWNIPMFD